MFFIIRSLAKQGQINRKEEEPFIHLLNNHKILLFTLNDFKVVLQNTIKQLDKTKGLYYSAKIREDVLAVTII